MALSRKEKRLAVCQDVLDSMSIRHVDSQGYLTLKLKEPVGLKSLPTDNLQDYIPALEEKCNVCALGSCLLSFVKLYDNVPTTSFIVNSMGYSYPSPSIDAISPVLARIFSKFQLMLIETAFEHNLVVVPSTYKFTTDVLSGRLLKILKKAQKFGSKYRSPKNRLTAIMKNIIANDGLFKPGKNPV